MRERGGRAIEGGGSGTEGEREGEGERGRWRWRWRWRGRETGRGRENKRLGRVIRVAEDEGFALAKEREAEGAFGAGEAPRR